MPRPRKYPNDAARSAAYRERLKAATMRIDRAAVEQLVAAVELAAAAGCEEAEKVRTGSIAGLIRNLAHLFEQKAG